MEDSVLEPRVLVSHHIAGCGSGQMYQSCACVISVQDRNRRWEEWEAKSNTADQCCNGLWVGHKYQ